MPYTAVGRANTARLSYSKFIKQHKVKSNTKENDAVKGHSKRKTYEAVVASATWHTVLQQTLFLIGRK